MSSEPEKPEEPYDWIVAALEARGAALAALETDPEPQTTDPKVDRTLAARREQKKSTGLKEQAAKKRGIQQVIAEIHREVQVNGPDVLLGEDPRDFDQTCIA